MDLSAALLVAKVHMPAFLLLAPPGPHLLGGLGQRSVRPFSCQCHPFPGGQPCPLLPARSCPMSSKVPLLGMCCSQGSQAPQSIRALCPSCSLPHLHSRTGGLWPQLDWSVVFLLLMGRSLCFCLARGWVKWEQVLCVS